MSWKFTCHFVRVQTSSFAHSSLVGGEIKVTGDFYVLFLFPMFQDPREIFIFNQTSDLQSAFVERDKRHGEMSGCFFINNEQKR